MFSNGKFIKNCILYPVIRKQGVKIVTTVTRRDDNVVPTQYGTESALFYAILEVEPVIGRLLGANINLPIDNIFRTLR